MSFHCAVPPAQSPAHFPDPSSNGGNYRFPQLPLLGYYVHMPEEPELFSPHIIQVRASQWTTCMPAACIVQGDLKNLIRAPGSWSFSAHLLFCPWVVSTARSSYADRLVEHCHYPHNLQGTSYFQPDKSDSSSFNSTRQS